MPTPEPFVVHESTVALDYGQFVLWGSEWYDGDGTTELLRLAQAGCHLASDDHSVLVIVPHQNNFAMPLSVEVWAEAPPRDFGAWQEIFECGLTVEGGRLWYGSPTLGSRSYEVPDGSYGVRICGRGFVNRGWPGSTTPGDEWRVQLWPSRRRFPDRRIREWKPARREADPAG